MKKTDQVLMRILLILATAWAAWFTVANAPKKVSELNREVKTVWAGMFPAPVKGGLYMDTATLKKAWKKTGSGRYSETSDTRFDAFDGEENHRLAYRKTGAGVWENHSEKHECVDWKDAQAELDKELGVNQPAAK